MGDATKIMITTVSSGKNVMIFDTTNNQVGGLQKLLRKFVRFL